MKEYILLMHSDVRDQHSADDSHNWDNYLSTLRGSGQFDSGSAIGQGQRYNKHSTEQQADTDISGFIRIRAENLQAARQLLAGNPVYEAGGLVEIREVLAH